MTIHEIILTVQQAVQRRALQRNNLQTHIVIIIVLLIVIAGSLWFYQDYKKTQRNVVEAESKLVPQGFNDFYQKQGNKFCVKKDQNKQEQQAIIQDMLWILETDEHRKIKEVECEEGRGIEIR